MKLQKIRTGSEEQQGRGDKQVPKRTPRARGASGRRNNEKGVRGGHFKRGKVADFVTRGSLGQLVLRTANAIAGKFGGPEDRDIARLPIGGKVGNRGSGMVFEKTAQRIRT